MESVSDWWKNYKNKGGGLSATELGVYLIRNAAMLEASGQTSGNLEAVIEPLYSKQGQEGYFPTISDSNAAAILVGRLERFVHFQAKPVFKESGLENPDDFGLLASLFFKPFISKGQLLKQSLVEPATGTEILKRMKKAGWIDEKPNPDDGRSLLVALTEKGRSLTMDCFNKLSGITTTLGTLSDNERAVLLTILQKLDHCHSERHQIKTVFNWMSEAAVEFPAIGT